MGPPARRAEHPLRGHARASSFEEELRHLYEERFAALFRYVHRLTGDPAVAADITQETFVRLHERGAVPDDARAWLGTVATNLVRDHERTARRRAELLTAEAVLPAQAPSPEEELLGAERRQGVRRALEALPARDREMLLLRHEGFSYREIADIVGVAPGSVGTLLIRATTAFERAYAAQGHDAA